MGPMQDRSVLVTGATSGIGLESARLLAALGARVLVHGRSKAKADEAAEDVSHHGEAVGVWGDFALFSEVRALAEQVASLAPVLDVLVNNAGVYMTTYVQTRDKHEMTLQVNHLSPFLLTNLLLDRLCAAKAGRVITVSSVAHFRGALDLDDLEKAEPFDGYTSYATSKLENVMFALELAERLKCESCSSNVLHPGVVTTKLLRTGFPNANGASLAEGAATTVYLASSPEVAGVTGSYFADRRRAHASPKAQDPDLRRALWEKSAGIVGL